MRIEFVSIEITDYDEAIRFYGDCLGFNLVEDVPMDADSGQRWITMRPPGGNTSDVAFTLNHEMVGRMLGALRTDNVWEEYTRLLPLGVDFIGEPVEYPFGTGVGFRDPFGNQFFMAEEMYLD